jgi:hypothetical protein
MMQLLLVLFPNQIERLPDTMLQETAKDICTTSQGTYHSPHHPHLGVGGILFYAHTLEPFNDLV